MTFKESARIGNQGKTRRVRFWKPVESERSDGLNDPILGFARDSFGFHSSAQLDLHFLHARFRAFEAEGPAKFFGLSAGKSRGDHGNAKKLFLEERHAQCSRERGFQERMQRLYWFAPLPAVQVGMNHLSHDRAGADDGYLDNNVIEALRLKPRKARHLRPAFHLEKSDGIGLLQRGINSRIIRGKAPQVNFFAMVAANEPERVFEDSHHAKAQKVDLDDPHIRTIFFVPLHNDTAGHGRWFERDDRVQLPLADDHSTRMLAQMARQILNFLAKFKKLPDPVLPKIQACILELPVECVLGVGVLPGAD